MGLRLRLVLALLLPIMVALSMFGYLRAGWERHARLEEFEHRVNISSRTIRLAIERDLRDRDLADSENLATDLLVKQTEVVRVRLVDLRLQPVFDRTLLSGDPGVPLDRHQHVIQTGEPEAVTGRLGNLTLYSTLLPVRPADGVVRGVLEIAYLSGRLEKDLLKVDRETIFQMALLFALVLILGTLILQRFVFRPLADLSHAIERVSGGDLEARVPVTCQGELGRVADAFNRMTERLRATHDQLMDLLARLIKTETLATAGRLCSGLAHAVGTPLNVITGRAELMLQSVPREHSHYQDLQVILAQIDRVSRIIRTTLDPFRPHEPAPKLTVLASLLEPALPLVRHLARNRGVTLAVTLPPDAPAVFADAAHLQQVLIHLLIGSIEASPKGGQVEVTVKQDGAGLIVAIRDMGPTIPPELLSSAFNPLGVANHGNGRGLGLLVSQGLIRQLGSEIHVESTPETGTTFSMWLPTAER